MNIDFELAKRIGATHYCDGSNALMKNIGDSWVIWLKREAHWVVLEHTLPTMIKLIEPEETTHGDENEIDWEDKVPDFDQPTHCAVGGSESVEWVDGVPPVGFKCKVKVFDGEDWSGWQEDSYIVTMAKGHFWIAHFGNFHRLHEMHNVEFESMETPEQKAERDAVEKASEYLHEKGFAHDQLMLKALYSKGMLKLDNE